MTVSAPKSGRSCGASAREAVRLDPEKHDVGRANRTQVARDLRSDLEIAFSTGDTQPAGLHRMEMRTARVQHDIGAGPCQPCADVAADRACACDDDLHEAC